MTKKLGGRHLKSIYQKTKSWLGNTKGLPVITILIFSFLLILPQILTKGVIAGSDFLFHYNRFFETAMQIKTGNFSYFISLYGFNSSGRIVNALYGPYFAYFQGLLVLISKNWFSYQLISRFLLGSMAGFSMFSLLRRAGVRKKISLPIALLYITTFSIQYWTMRQGFTSWGAAFMPWCLIPAIDFVKDKRISIPRLAISVALMVQVHMLSAFFLICLYLPFYLFGFFKSKEKIAVLLKGLTAAFLSLLLSSNIWAALIAVGSKNNLVEPFVNSKLYIMTVNQRSIEWLLTPLPLLALVLYILYFAFRHWRHFDDFLKTVVGSFFLFLVLSSSIFPWYSINKLNLGLVNLIQFPFRFFIPATILLLLAFALILERYFDVKWSPTVNLVLLVLTFISLAHSYKLQNDKIQVYFSNTPIKQQKHQDTWGNAEEIRAAFQSSDKHELLDLIAKSTPDYLPADKNNKENKYNLYEQFVIETTDNFQKSQDDGSLTLTWTSDTQSRISIPIAKYADTQLTLNGEPLTSKDYSLTAIGTPRVKQAIGTNTLTVTYKTSSWFYPVLFSNLLAITATPLYLAYRKWTHKKV